MRVETVHAIVIAHGRVQGVFYRDTIRRAAVEFGVAGSAVNIPDGRVECHFEGTRADVEAMIEVAREGSSSASVRELRVSWSEPTGLTGFQTG
ncbi:MAG: acylphosphatase [Solirubrobacterales bacterium]